MTDPSMSRSSARPALPAAARQAGPPAAHAAALPAGTGNNRAAPLRERASERVRVAFQGGPGAYSEIAVARHFERARIEVDAIGVDSFRSLTEAVASGRVDCGMLPVENTTAGSITEAYDLLLRSRLAAVGEEVLRVQHCLLALQPTPLEQLRRVLSHPQALAQCTDFLASLPDCRAEAFLDTALAAAHVRERGDPTVAAIASERAARLHGLSVLRRDIADQRDNYTRFLVVAREPRRSGFGQRSKTSLAFATRHEQGALLRCLEALARHGLNLTNLQSRPRPGRPWEYLFYVEFEGDVGQEAVRRALEQLAARASFVRTFGSYPACPGTRRSHRAAAPRPS